jgi:hypothetical protein
MHTVKPVKLIVPGLGGLLAEEFQGLGSGARL